MNTFCLGDVTIMSEKVMSELRGSDQDKTIINSFKAIYKGDIVGSLSASIYIGPNCSRRNFTCFNFEHNKYRTLWIDTVEIKEEFRLRGICLKMFKCAETWLRSEGSRYCYRKNYYLFATYPNCETFEKLGYSVIECGSDDTIYEDGCWDTELYPICYYESELGAWMAKPIGGDSLDREIIRHVEIYVESGEEDEDEDEESD